MATAGTPSLTSTLILALTQSEASQRQLDESDRTIERLKRENEKLKQELLDLRRATQQPQNNQPDLAAQLDHFFKQDAEKQAEIDSLKKRLARAKEGRQQTQTPNPSSPIVSADEPKHSSSRKRVRQNSQEHDRPLRDITNSSPGNRPQQRLKSKGFFSNRGAEAIHLVAEDGIDHNKAECQGTVAKAVDASSAASQRLQALLAPSPHVAQPISSRKPASSNRDPEDDEPLRSRPLHRLNLSHFKVNPKFADGLDYAFQEVVRNKEARKCLPSCTKPECCGASFKALAKTLPPDPTITEDDLLLEFLGPGSGERINGLTPLARTNLIHEARAKRLANTYGRMHRTNFEAPSSPPDYWLADMPSTQEQKENWEQSKLKERIEVEKRYTEAMKAKDGRWLFTDE